MAAVSPVGEGGKPTQGEPLEALRWLLAERFGWTLEYVDSLSVADVHEFLQVEDGRKHVRESIIIKR